MFATLFAIMLLVMAGTAAQAHHEEDHERGPGGGKGNAKAHAVADRDDGDNDEGDRDRDDNPRNNGNAKPPGNDPGPPAHARGAATGDDGPIAKATASAQKPGHGNADPETSGEEDGPAARKNNPPTEMPVDPGDAKAADPGDESLASVDEGNEGNEENERSEEAGQEPDIGDEKQSGRAGNDDNEQSVPDPGEPPTEAAGKPTKPVQETVDPVPDPPDPVGDPVGEVETVTDRTHDDDHDAADAEQSTPTDDAPTTDPTGGGGVAMNVDVDERTALAPRQLPEIGFAYWVDGRSVHVLADPVDEDDTLETPVQYRWIWGDGQTTTGGAFETHRFVEGIEHTIITVTRIEDGASTHENTKWIDLSYYDPIHQGPYRHDATGTRSHDLPGTVISLDGEPRSQDSKTQSDIGALVEAAPAPPILPLVGLLMVAALRKGRR